MVETQEGKFYARYRDAEKRKVDADGLWRVSGQDLCERRVDNDQTLRNIRNPLNLNSAMLIIVVPPAPSNMPAIGKEISFEDQESCRC